MTIDATLAAIDGALEDWGTSGDAMRWQPDPGRVICDGGSPLWPERYSELRHGTYHVRVSYAPFPAGNTRPLAINGAGYRRRQRNRKKR